MLTNKTLELLRAIGSPFADKVTIPRSEGKKLELYQHAIKNKIGLLYLERLLDMGMQRFLEKEYAKELNKERLFTGTVVNLFRNLEELGISCVAFKTILPFPCNLNDVDLLIMERNLKKEELVELLTRRGYMDYAHSPASISIHDLRDGAHLDQQKKDPYDIDVYEEISINQFKYLEKRRLEDHLIKIMLDGQDVWSFSPQADLAIQIIHSVVDWQLYTLMHYYSILYFLSSASRDQMYSFLRIVEENRITVATREAVLMTALLHLAAYDEVPSRFMTLLAQLKINFDKNFRLFNNAEAPLKYGVVFLARVLAEKASDTSAIPSMIGQVASMLHPRRARYLSWHLLHRRRTMTY